MCLASGAAMASNQYSVGVEGFYDDYSQANSGVDSQAYYGSVTAQYLHSWDKVFLSFDGRGSYGFASSNSSNSSSNSLERTPQWDVDGRIRLGFSTGGFSPYLGVGSRYYSDKLKVVATGEYDENTTQIYLPFGVSYFRKLENGWNIMPNLEFDYLIWGKVNSNLSSIPGLTDVSNDQNKGWGLRGSLMFGFGGDGGSNTWQVGPFFRYWSVSDSDTSVSGGNTGFVPHSTQMQAGVAARYDW
jgi:hypothetical protein